MILKHGLVHHLSILHFCQTDTIPQFYSGVFMNFCKGICNLLNSQMFFIHQNSKSKLPVTTTTHDQRVWYPLQFCAAEINQCKGKMQT